MQTSPSPHTRPPRGTRCASVLVLVALTFLLSASAVTAANMSVTTTADSSDGNQTMYVVPGNHTDGDKAGHKGEGCPTGEGHEEEEDEHGAGPLHVAALNYMEIRDPLIFTIVVLLAGVSKIGYHHADFLSSRIPESCILIILGTVFGAIIHFSGASDNLPQFFEPHQFFIFLLPPIILEASYSLHDRTVLENIGSILLFAVLGTVLASMFLGLSLYGLAQAGAMGSLPEVNFIQMMIFASLIVAVDPVAVLAVFNEIGVNHVLYFMVFGESLLNDGVTVVLYKVFQSYNVMDEVTGVHILLGFIKFLVVCLGGLALGILAGIGTAVLTKFSTHVKVAQPIIIFMMAYFGFLLAEMFEFSGIISIIGCGLTQVQYAFHNISDKSRTTVKYFVKVISTCMEIIIFLFLGLSIVNDDHEWNTGFTLWTIVLCLVFRFLIIFAMSAMINRFDFHRVRTISLYEQFMIAYGGLRGAVCFSLVALLSSHEVPAKSMFMTTTLAVILFTVFVQGITIKPLVFLLQISLAPEKSRSMYQELSGHVTDHMMAGMEDIIGEHGRNHLREKLERLDGKYLKPLLEVDPDPRDAQLKNFYENLLLKEHYNYLKLSGAKTPESMPELSHEQGVEGVLAYLSLAVLSSFASPNISSEMLVSTLMGGGGASATHPLLMHPNGDEFGVGPRASMPGTPNIVISQDPDVTFRKCGGMGGRSKSIASDNRHIDAMGLRNLLRLQRDSQMIMSRYDRNLTSSSDHPMQQEIQRRKTNRNRRLQRLMSESGSSAASPVQKRKSWCEVESELATEREKPAPVRHAATVDLGSGVGRLGTVDPISPGFLGSHQLDSVFEEDEEKGSSVPILPAKGKVAAAYELKEKEGKEEGEKEVEEADGKSEGLKHHGKSVLRRQVGMDRATPSPSTERSRSGERDAGGGPKMNIEQEGEGDMPLVDIRDRAGSGEKPDRDSKV